MDGSIIYWECHNPNWRTPSFFRGVGIPPTSIVFLYLRGTNDRWICYHWRVTCWEGSLISSRVGHVVGWYRPISHTSCAAGSHNPIAGSSPQMVDDVQVLTMTLSWIIMSICGQLQVAESVGVCFVWFLEPGRLVLESHGKPSCRLSLSITLIMFLGGLSQPRGYMGWPSTKKTVHLSQIFCWKGVNKKPNSYPKNSGRLPGDITMVPWWARQVFLNSSSMKMTQIRSQAHHILR